MTGQSRRGRLRGLLVAAIVLPACAWAGPAPAQERGGGRQSARPAAAQRGARDDRRSDRGRHGGHAPHPPPAGRGRGDVRPLVRFLPALLPLACDLPHRPVRPQQPRPLPLPGVRRRLPAPEDRRVPAGLARAGRIRDRARGQVPERLWDRAAGGPTRRLDGVVRRSSITPPTGCGATRSTRTAAREPTDGRSADAAPLPDRRAGQQRPSPSSAATPGRTRSSCRWPSWLRTTSRASCRGRPTSSSGPPRATGALSGTPLP